MRRVGRRRVETHTGAMPEYLAINYHDTYPPDPPRGGEAGVTLATIAANPADGRHALLEATVAAGPGLPALASRALPLLRAMRPARFAAHAAPMLPGVATLVHCSPRPPAGVGANTMAMAWMDGGEVRVDGMLPDSSPCRAGLAEIVGLLLAALAPWADMAGPDGKGGGRAWPNT